jgi:hypothetical protein
VPPEGGQTTPPALPGKSGGSREVIFEFTPVGVTVKATVIDVLTGVEVSVIGPAGPASQRELERVALAKLKQRLEREGHSTSSSTTASLKKKDVPEGGSGGATSGGGMPPGGIIV